MPRRLTLALCLAIPGLAADLAVAGEGPAFEKVARPILEKFCLNCHGEKRAKGGVSIVKLKDGASVAADVDLAQLVADSIADGSMPPKDKPAPSEADRQAVAESIEATLAELEKVRDPGPSLIQRLTRRQYNNTIRDLLGVDTHPADAFPADGGGGGGFDNNASTLFVPPILMEKYLAAAVDVLDKADPKHWRAASPGFLTRNDAARRCFEIIRRQGVPPASDQGGNRPPDDPLPPGRRARRLVRRFGQVRAAGSARLAALPLPGRARRADGRGVPGERLRAGLAAFVLPLVVDAGRETLRAGRVGEAPRARGVGKAGGPDARRPQGTGVATDFAAQWLRVDTLAVASEPDRRKYPTYTHELRDAMIEEPLAFFHGLLRDNRPITDLIGADYSYLNETLAKHYGVVDVKGAEFREVTLKDKARGGVLGMGAILTLTSYPQRTSPVLRGKWVLEEILGTPPPPPPSMVKVLPADDRPKDGQTLRQRLEAHRKDAGCAGCHAKLDPLGFGLESFDPIGRFRTEIGDKPVDAAGTLTTGETFNGPAELKKILCESKCDLFVKNVTSKMLSYALRRGLEYYDQRTVKAIVATLEEKGYSSRVLVAEIVKSYPFQYRRDEPVGRAKP